jgi:predicted DNA-binding WGR domain protein
MELLSFLLLHTAARFYRVEVAETLFGDYAVSREWGARGRPGQRGSAASATCARRW